MQLPHIPSDVPFTGEQKAWLAGFLAGLNTRIGLPSEPAPAAVAAAATAAVAAPAVGGGAAPQPEAAAGPAAADAGPRPLLIVYGTQTGNAEYVAEQVETAAAEHGFAAETKDMGDMDLDTLAAAKHLVIVCSTYGEGEMPDDAEDFWQEVAGPDAPRLDGAFFGVVALGDSIYDGFCQAGKNFDARLAELGATRVIDRVDCDVDYQGPADEWIVDALPALAAAGAEPAVATAAVVAEQVAAEPVAEEPAPAIADTPVAEPPAPEAAPAKSTSKSDWGRKNPYPATIVTNSVLSGATSAKEVRHIEISLGDSGIAYEPGDGISIAAVNDPSVVDLILKRIGATGDEVIKDRKTEHSLRDALTYHYEIGVPTKYLVDYIAKRTHDPEIGHLVDTGDHEALDAWLYGRDVLDVLNVDPDLTITPEELIAELKPLAARVYSISSSPRVHEGSVHITMAAVRYRTGDRDRGGVCSTYLADRRPVGEQVGVYITPNKSFRLPADDAKVIMIGPGTGVAPFRAFLHERVHRGATGDNWLFFGDQHRASDFIYADEFGQFVTDGVLTHLDLAFSRDQEHKVYVQNRMLEKGAEFFSWLESGAHIYVCGDATRMAHDVDEALHEIVAQHGGLSANGAEAYISKLKSDKRYLRDVY
ncbi:sulfite reductase subunit alpha [Gordonia amarae]|uniref:assimilatory sulfite reductase (NADPH) n=2 Tax=Gordonia amarae TaxID=36821 RepID=G7GRH3_9ACTN|nr:sulfite reductase subunit alpha [Gordonia amarae]MCS3878433.1 sulfite reductase (NADPH) flavoprotein alpha-component [Gordonia amarae]QHN30428.1 sulfite reductase subunit alpha [Gordonia amarae]QHN39204.1 sulfite reductase subunit alpha [Gordonia amarae]GAB06198.1 NADPH--sulfite reductase flavoprotein alpha-component [Gordonia amarae NBRC 15530]